MRRYAEGHSGLRVVVVQGIGVGGTVALLGQVIEVVSRIAQKGSDLAQLGRKQTERVLIDRPGDSIERSMTFRHESVRPRNTVQQSNREEKPTINSGCQSWWAV